MSIALRVNKLIISKRMQGGVEATKYHSFWYLFFRYRCRV